MEDIRILTNFPNYAISNYGYIINVVTNKIISTRLTTSKFYKYVTLLKDNKKHCVAIHTLVAKTFIPNPNNFKCVTFLNDDVLNCSVDNLVWSNNKDLQKSKRTINSYEVVLSKNGLEPMIFPSLSKAARYLGIKYTTLLYHYGKNNKVVKDYNITINKF